MNIQSYEKTQNPSGTTLLRRSMHVSFICKLGAAWADFQSLLHGVQVQATHTTSATKSL